jgi:hypothetical protein
MPPTRKYFSAPVLEAIDAAYVIGIRAGPTGRQAHRFIGIWAVVVDRRVFVRSWDITPGGWYDTIRKERRGHIHVGGRTLAVRSAPVRSERLASAVDNAYALRYKTPGARHYVRGFRRGRRRTTTTELIPTR